MEISKELLSEVLGEKDIKGIHKDSEYTFDTFDKELSNSEILIEFDTIYYKSHMVKNIYELANDCKMKMKENGYVIDSNTLGTVKISKIEKPLTAIAWVDNSLELSKLPLVEKEFKACQWILENKA